MKAIFENKYNFTEAQINIPFIVGNTPIGVVCEVDKDIFTIQIFDKFIGLEILNNNIDAIYLSEKEQISIEEQKVKAHVERLIRKIGNDTVLKYK
jgi:hypothetical protein